ncbi:MAG: hypothetical protein PHN45_01940, partial [Methylococcales bacterium]|nr:hypothetical protein [Methylococcales bacterium]
PLPPQSEAFTPITPHTTQPSTPADFAQSLLESDYPSVSQLFQITPTAAAAAINIPQPMIVETQPQLVFPEQSVYPEPVKTTKKRGQKRKVSSVARQNLYERCMLNVEPLNSDECYGGQLQGMVCGIESSSNCDFRKVKVPSNYATLDRQVDQQKYTFYLQSTPHSKILFHLGRAKVRFASAALMQTTYSKVALTRHFLPFVGYHSTFGIDSRGDVYGEHEIPGFNARLAGHFTLVNPARITFNHAHDTDGIVLIDIENWKWGISPVFVIFKALVNTITMVYTGSYNGVCINQDRNTPVYLNPIEQPSGNVANHPFECFRLPNDLGTHYSSAISLINTYARSIVDDKSLVAADELTKYYRSPDEVISMNGTLYYVNEPFFSKKEDQIVANPKYINSKFYKTHQQQYARAMGFHGVALDNLKMASLIYVTNMWAMYCKLILESEPHPEHIDMKLVYGEMQRSHLFFLTDFEHRMLCLTYASMSMYRNEFFDYKYTTTLDFTKAQTMKKQQYCVFMTEMLLQYHSYNKRTSKKNKTNMMNVYGNGEEWNNQLFMDRMDDIQKAMEISNLYNPHPNTSNIDENTLNAYMEHANATMTMIRNIQQHPATLELKTRIDVPVHGGEQLSPSNDVNVLIFRTMETTFAKVKQSAKNVMNVSFGCIFGDERIKRLMVHIVRIVDRLFYDFQTFRSDVAILQMQNKITTQAYDIISNQLMPLRTTVISTAEEDIQHFLAFFEPMLTGIGDVYIDSIGNK